MPSRPGPSLDGARWLPECRLSAMTVANDPQWRGLPGRACCYWRGSADTSRSRRGPSRQRRGPAPGPAAAHGLLGLGRLQAELEAIFDTKVNLVPASDLKPAVRAGRA